MRRDCAAKGSKAEPGKDNDIAVTFLPRRAFIR